MGFSTQRHFTPVRPARTMRAMSSTTLARGAAEVQTPHDVGALAFEHLFVALVEVRRVHPPAFAEPLALLGVQVRAADHLHLGHVHIAAHVTEGHEPAAPDYLVVNRVGNASQTNQACTIPLAYHPMVLSAAGCPATIPVIFSYRDHRVRATALWHQPVTCDNGIETFFL